MIDSHLMIQICQDRRIPGLYDLHDLYDMYELYDLAHVAAGGGVDSAWSSTCLLGWICR